MRRLTVGALVAMLATVASGCAPTPPGEVPSAEASASPTSSVPSVIATAPSRQTPLPASSGPTSPTASPTPASSPSAPTAPPVASGPATPVRLAGDHTAAEVRSWVANPSTAEEKIVFLTFDDGPNDTRTPEVLDVLKAAGVKATFFVVGMRVPEAVDILQREAAEGHRIALHSQSHDYEKLYPDGVGDTARILQEYDSTLSNLRWALGQDFTTTAWRYPGGHGSWKGLAEADAELAERGVTWLDWNAMTGDAEPMKRRPTTAEGMVDLAVRPIAEKTPVVLMLAHDDEDMLLTVGALPEIIAAYAAAGYAFGTLI